LGVKECGSGDSSDDIEVLKAIERAKETGNKIYFSYILQCMCYLIYLFRAKANSGNGL
jgi:hypothetical protein